MDQTIPAVVGKAPYHVTCVRSLATHLLENAKKDIDKAGVTTPLLAIVTGDMMHVFVAVPFFAGRLHELAPFSQRFAKNAKADGAAFVVDAFTLEGDDRKQAIQVYAQWKNGQSVALERPYIRGGQLVVWESPHEIRGSSDLSELLFTRRALWRCPNGCNPLTDRPFFYPAEDMPGDESRYPGGALVWIDGTLSDRTSDGDPIDQEDLEAISAHTNDRLPRCIECESTVKEIQSEA